MQLIVPQGHMLFERGAVDSRAEELVKRGAVGVFNLVRLPGNELSRDFSDCGNPCFNIGGRDGLFLESILDRAAQAGVPDKVRAQHRSADADLSRPEGDQRRRRSFAARSTM